MRKANGRARHSMIRKAIYVSGVTPPSTPLMWFFDKLNKISNVVLHRSSLVHDLLDGTSYELSQITSNNPEREVLATRA